MDFNKIKEMGLEYAEKGKNAALDLAEKGKTQALIVNEQGKLLKHSASWAHWCTVWPRERKKTSRWWISISR